MGCFRGNMDRLIGAKTVRQVLDDVWHRVFAGALSRCMNAEDAKDITQEAVSKAVVAMDSRYDLAGFPNDIALHECLHRVSCQRAGDALDRLWRFRQKYRQASKDASELEKE